MYVYIWQYRIVPGSKLEFERVYGTDGDWARLFRCGKGYICTDLLKDRKHSNRYLTVDYWESKAAYRNFLSDWKNEFAELDRMCEELTDEEIKIGEYQPTNTIRRKG